MHENVFPATYSLEIINKNHHLSNDFLVENFAPSFFKTFGIFQLKFLKENMGLVGPDPPTRISKIFDFFFRAPPGLKLEVIPFFGTLFPSTMPKTMHGGGVQGCTTS